MSGEVDMSRRQNANPSMGSDPMEVQTMYVRDEALPATLTDL